MTVAIDTTGSSEANRRRKRLGQYFTGEPLARLLAALAHADTAQTIIDPMGGSGDMLAGCLDVGAVPHQLTAIEIDNSVAAECEGRLRANSAFSVVHGSAFDLSSWDGLPGAWDLVITNPPYVRYQTGSTQDLQDPKIPGAESIRRSLLQTLTTHSDLESSDREVFRQCAANYSGLSDLAVPSWLLCASLVRPGGRLAMVVPDTWLSRDYAVPVLFILHRFFEVEFVVRDSDVSWFDDALVRATLVIAKRISDPGRRRPSRTPGYLNISLSESASKNDSLVGNLFPNRRDSEIAFAEWSRQLLGQGIGANSQSVVAEPSDGTDILRGLGIGMRRHAWLRNLNGDAPAWAVTAPEQLDRLLSPSPANLVSLETLGWSAGQGLRTGANDFFYVSALPNGRVKSPLMPDEELLLPREVLHRAVRNQGDLPNEGGRKAVSNRHMVLELSGWVLPEDLGDEPSEGWRVMDGDLARLVRKGASTTYMRTGRPVAIPELSAVRTNVRKASDINAKRRYWYHLPALQARHRPHIFIPRVNGRAPVPYLNESSRVIVDANFSTLWPSQRGAASDRAVIALLSSSWTRSFLELIGTVLGGGALKIEATHLCRLHFPSVTEYDINSLEQLGDDLLQGDADASALKAIDEVVLGAMRPRLESPPLAEVAALSDQLHRSRSS